MGGSPRDLGGQEFRADDPETGSGKKAGGRQAAGATAPLGNQARPWTPEARRRVSMGGGRHLARGVVSPTTGEDMIGLIVGYGALLAVFVTLLAAA